MLVFLVSGCSTLSPPTFIPEEQLPTVIELTAEALVAGGLVTPPPPPTKDPSAPTETPLPSDTPLPTSQETEYTPTETLDLVISTSEPLTLPDPLPQGEVQIISPGRLSRVLSPFKLHVYLASPNTEKEEDISYQISLYGNDGRLLVRHLFTQEAGQKHSSHLVMDITFEISGEAETARLEVKSQDRYGRTSALTSTDLVLLTDGEPEIKSILDLYQSLIVQQPIPSTLIQGDALLIQGVTRIAPEDQLLVELMNRNGGLIGSDVVTVSDLDLGKGYRPFEGEIPFQVAGSSWIRVQVTARDGKFSGIQHVTSVEVLISP